MFAAQKEKQDFAKLKPAEFTEAKMNIIWPLAAQLLLAWKQEHDEFKLLPIQK